MRKIRFGAVLLLMLLCCPVTFVSAEVNIGIGLPNVSIGINLPLFPELVPVPGYPVYYAPRLDANYFFYDGMYWVYLDDYWYASNWYNGPWWLVEPEFVPLFILRIPVRYYRSPPVYFRSWRRDAPPRWNDRWGRDWEHNRRGWDRWNRSSVPSRAPLPTYQRQYSGDRYPREVEQQHRLRGEHYRYEPRDRAIRQRFQRQEEQRTPAPARRERQEVPRMRGTEQQDIQRPAPRGQEAPAVRRSQPSQPAPQERGPALREQREQRVPALQEQRTQPGAVQRERQAPRQQEEQRFQDRGRSQEQRDQGEEQRRGEGRGRGRND